LETLESILILFVIAASVDLQTEITWQDASRMWAATHFFSIVLKHVKRHALKLFQDSFCVYDDRFELNNDLTAIVEMTQPNISPELNAKLLNCQAASCS